MEVDDAFQARVLAIVQSGPRSNKLAPEGLEVLHAEIGSTQVTWPAGRKREVPAIRLQYRWRGEEGHFEFALDPELWGGFSDPEHAVNYVWIDLDETLTAID